MTASRGINRPKWRPTDDQVEQMRRDFGTTPTIELAQRFGVAYHQVAKLAEKLGLKKDETYLNSAGGRLDGVRGMGTRFQKGHAPWSKGRKLPGNGGSTSFKPGHKPFNYVPVGSYRIESGGYLQKKITETGYPPRDWVMVHRLVWMDAHGPIPEGHVVAFKPGRRTNELEHITLDALELVARHELLNRNRMPPELQKLVQLRGALTRQINKRSKT